MSAEKDADLDDTTCPNCGAGVVYGGAGRRPVWCSTRCRNDASLKRLGARRAAVEVRVVEVLRHRHTASKDGLGRAVTTLDRDVAEDPTSPAKAPTPTAEQALRILRNDPESIGKLLSHLERRRVDGTLAEPQWLPVRNALRLIAEALPPGIERRSACS